MQAEEIEERASVDFPIEHFPDRSARWLLQDKQYVRGLVEIVASELVRYRAIMYLLLLILHRRPAEEHNELLTLVERYTEEMEVSPMAQSMAEMLLERGKAQGIEQGIERGVRETTIKNILSILNAKFPQNNPQHVQQKLELILDTDSLTQLHLRAIQASNFEAFLQALDT